MEKRDQKTVILNCKESEMVKAIRRARGEKKITWVHRKQISEERGEKCYRLEICFS